MLSNPRPPDHQNGAYLTELHAETGNRLLVKRKKERQAFKRALLFLLFLLFPTFLCSYFSLLFFWNALLSLLLSPKMFEVTKNCNFFPRLLEVCKTWINLIWAVTMQMFMKYFYFSCNSFFGTIILVFPYHGDVVLLFRENCFLILSFSKSENTQNIPTLLTFHDLNSYFCPTFSKFWALFYTCFFTGGHLTAWKEEERFYFPCQTKAMGTFINTDWYCDEGTSALVKEKWRKHK